MLDLVFFWNFFASKVLHFFSKKVAKYCLNKKFFKLCGHVLFLGSNCHFCQKKCIFWAEKGIFQISHFIKKLSVTQNTLYEENHPFIKKFEMAIFTRFNQGMSLKTKILTLFQLAYHTFM